MRRKMMDSAIPVCRLETKTEKRKERTDGTKHKKQ
jgi:hypothetical protein